MHASLRACGLACLFKKGYLSGCLSCDCVSCDWGSPAVCVAASSASSQGVHSTTPTKTNRSPASAASALASGARGRVGVALVVTWAFYLAVFHTLSNMPLDEALLCVALGGSVSAGCEWFRELR